MQGPEGIVAAALRPSLERLILEDGITTVFQPIVDLSDGALFAYEALSRGALPFSKAQLMFDTAERCNLSWDLDRSCRTAALRAVASLPLPDRGRTFFLNVNPRAITDRRSIQGFTLSAMKALGVRQEQIVIEVTESASIDDYDAFEKQIRHYASQGFRIALDDFGSGHSGLLTLVATAPHFIKLDRRLVSGLDADPYRQKLIAAVVAFAAQVGTELVGEGIQRREERETLRALGVRYGQGFLIGKPMTLPDGASEPAPCPATVEPQSMRTAGNLTPASAS